MGITSSQNSIIFVGNTGVGKSYICNHLFQICGVDTRFKSSASNRSVTNELQTGEIHYNGTGYTLVDTPGFFDTTESGDGLNFCKLVKALENCGSIVAVVFVYTDRFSTQHQIWFDRMKNLLGDSYRGHIVLLHNKLGPPDPGMKAENKASIRDMINSTQEYIWFSFFPGQDQVELTLKTLTKFSPFRLGKVQVPELCYEKVENGEPYEDEIARNTRDEGYMETRTKDTSHYETRDSDVPVVVQIFFPITRIIPPRQVWVNSSVEEQVWVPNHVTRRTVVTRVDTFKIRYDGTRDLKETREISRREEIV